VPGRHGQIHNQASGKAYFDVDLHQRVSNFSQLWKLEYPFPDHASAS
jgi:hypothetical protein